ncbi:MAG: fluoride efflux transporter CrcB [Pseudomonadota bacterium]
MSQVQTYLLVALGGGAGASLRFFTTQFVGRLMGPGFPYGTMTVNIVGSFAMGLLVTWLAEKVDGGAGLRLALATGFLGGFTTFSAFSLDAHALYVRGLMLQAGGYVLGSVLLSLIAVFLGIWAGRQIWA